MRFSKENQPTKRRHTDEPRESYNVTIKHSTKEYFKGKRGEAGRVLDEYVNEKAMEDNS